MDHGEMNNLAFKTMGIFVIRTLESRRLCRVVRQSKIGETNAEYGILENAPPHQRRAWWGWDKNKFYPMPLMTADYCSSIITTL